MRSCRFSNLKFSISAVAVIVGAAAVSSAAFAATVEIPLDQVRVLTFSAPVKTVFVGNPVIADVTVIDSTHVFILGKNLGITNVIALDARGNQAVNDQISVLDRSGTVNLQRGAARSTLNCTDSRCDAAPTPGDDNARYTSETNQLGAREALAQKAAGGQ
jgi:Flp pilus assembly secretin CpaC